MNYFKVKLSDHTTRIVSELTLKEWDEIAAEYDGFKAYTVEAKVERPGLIDRVMAWAAIPDPVSREMFLAETAKEVS